MKTKFIEFISNSVLNVFGTRYVNNSKELEIDKKYMFVWSGSSGTYDVYHAIETEEGE